MEKDAIFSDCRQYRFVLWRIWDETKPSVMFVGLNPSTADETQDDPTIRRCLKYAQSWDFGGLYMTNLFAFCATHPHQLKQAIAPIGEDNDRWLVELSQQVNLIIAAWGNHGTFFNRSRQVMDLLPNLHYLKLNKSGEPAHPLYLKANLKPTKMKLM